MLSSDAACLVVFFYLLKKKTNIMSGSPDKENKKPEKSCQLNPDDKIEKTLGEKDNITHEKESAIQVKDEEIQEKNTIIQEKDKLIQGKDDLIQEKDNLIKQKNNLIQEKDKIIQEKDNTIQEKDNKIQELVKKIQEKDNKIQKIVEEKDEKIQEKDKEIQNLQEDNSKFKKEASEYQYALGAATNFRLSDDDKNDSVKLKEDIIKLRHSLENYITKCKGNVEVNIPKVQELLKTYGSQTDITKDPKKPLIRVAIQRHIIEQILLYAKEYFGDKEQHIYGRGMESFMYRKANELIKVAEAFAVRRVGTDDTTKVFPTKLRQLIFAALGNRGFNNFINNNNQNFPHGFIKKYQEVLNKEIEKYRKIKDSEKKQEIEDMAGDIIRRVVTLFWFRFNVQEPIAEYFWFKYKEKINPSWMEGIWDEEDINNIVVDICHFPLIANKSTGQVYTPAKVFHIHKEEIEKTELSKK
jgi:hypothetical protein